MFPLTEDLPPTRFVALRMGRPELKARMDLQLRRPEPAQSPAAQSLRPFESCGRGGRILWRHRNAQRPNSP